MGATVAKEIQVGSKKSRRKRLGFILLAVGIVLFAVALASCMAVYWFCVEKRENMLIIAHRAGAFRAPENTLSALEQAVRDCADMAEIDIRQLSDGTLIVVHDGSFSRTCGAQLDVWKATYEDILTLDAGVGYYGSPSDDPVPTLEEMLECADGRMRLMIEVKTAGGEEDLEVQLLMMIHERGMERQCIIGSMDREVLRKVKEMDPLMETVYIAHKLEEKDYDLDYVDSYSVEVWNMSKQMVERIHEQDKPVYGWTVNSKSTMKILARLGADGIVTDNVPLAQRFRQKGSISTP